MLAHGGLSVSTDAINEIINSLSENAHAALQKLAKTLLLAFAYDNFDLTLDVGTPTVENFGRMMVHLTSGTGIPLLPWVLPEHLEFADYIWERSMNNRKRTVSLPELDFESLLALRDTEIDEDGLSSSQAFQAYQFLHDLLFHGPSYFHQFRSLLKEPKVKDQIPIVKTQQIPARAMNINMSTTVGNVDALENLQKQAGIGDPAEQPGVVDRNKYILPVHGDLGAGERILSAQRSRAIEATPWRRFQYPIFIMGLFHLKMACVDALWRIFLQPGKARHDDTSLMQDVGVLRPKETGKIGSKPKFRQLHEVVQMSGIASRVDCWRLAAYKRDADHTSLDKFAKSRPSWNVLVAMSKSLALDYVACDDFRDRRSKPDLQRDKQLENTLLRNQYFLLYEEITHAMNSGDIGRVESCFIPWIFIFRSCGKNKYASHMTQCLLELHYVYPEPLR